MKKKKQFTKKPVLSAFLLAVILSGCLLGRLFIKNDPAYMDLANYDRRPGREFWFGTDAMGRDIFSMVWQGGGISLQIGFTAAALSLVIAIVFGAASALAPRWLDMLFMGFTDILLSIPGLLLTVMLQAVLGRANVWSISFVLGATGWMQAAKAVRVQVRQIRDSEYVAAAKCMGAGFLHILRKHLAPDVMPTVMFMAVMNVRTAIIAESTLSFMGLGLGLETISWGSLLSLSQQALLSSSWHLVLIPGLFLVITLLCITSLGDYLRGYMNRGKSSL